MFGLDLFAGTPTTFAPQFDAPIPANYLIGPGDTVNVEIYGKVNQSYVLTVNRNGTLSIPEIGPIKVIGLTFDELKRFLPNKIKQKVIDVMA